MDLPSFASDLIGRTDDVATARRVLLGGEVRLLTLVGPAGIGKTRLSVEVAHGLASSLPDGVWFVDLSDVNDVESIPAAIVEVLGPHDAASSSDLARLHELLEARQLLLILDNFEQVGEGAGVLTELLASHPGLRILVTSRNPLHLKWEHTFILHPLHVPEGQELQNFDDIANSAAVRLFVQSAQSVRLDFALTPENMQDVVAICAYLEGIPLAIELAAAWTTLLPPATILTYLRSDPSFLHSRVRDVPARQQSLSAALDWSYDLLDVHEQELLRRLSVLLGGFTLDAARAVAGDTVPDMLDGLASLVDRSLVQLQPEDDLETERRFYLLETVRTNLLGRLEEHGELETAQKSHALYYLELAERERAKIRHLGCFIAPAVLPLPDDDGWQPESTFWLLDREYDNLRAALAWTERAGANEVGIKLAVALAPYWWIRALLAEGARYMEEAIRQNPDAPAALRARALDGLGTLLRRGGQPARAHALLEEALRLARTACDPPLLDTVLIDLATVELGEDESQLEAGTTPFQEALLTLRDGGDVWGVAVARSYLALAELFRLRGSSAEGCLRQVLSTFEDLGDSRSAGIVWLLLAAAAGLQDDGSQASSALAEATARLRDLDESSAIASCADLAAWLIRANDPLRAAILVGAADGVRETGFARSPYERRLHTEVMDDLQDRMHETDLESAVKQGRALTVAQILRVLDHQNAHSPVHDLEGISGAGVELSDREVEIIHLMSEGLSNKQIADTIFVSEGTAKLDIRSIYRKLGARNRAQAIGIAAERGLIRDSPLW
jgi:non-specific serine/threonine protein kinase